MEQREGARETFVCVGEGEELISEKTVKSVQEKNPSTNKKNNSEFSFPSNFSLANELALQKRVEGYIFACDLPLIPIGSNTVSKANTKIIKEIP